MLLIKFVDVVIPLIKFGYIALLISIVLFQMELL